MFDKLTGRVAAGMLAFAVLAAHSLPANSQSAAEPITIAAQPLAQALVDLNAQTGAQIAAPADIAAGSQAAPVNGAPNAETALDEMLRGTGLSYERTGENSYVILPVSNNADGSQSGFGSELTADEIIVQGGKIERSFLETPASVGILSSERIEDFVITDTFEGFNQLANVRRLNTDGGSDSFQIRGFGGDGIASIANPANAIALIIDGAQQNTEGLRRGARSTWDLEQIEVLRGPESGLYGRAALAGAVVLKSKDPTFFYEGAAQLNFGSQAAQGASFMVSGPVIEDQLALRITGDVQREEKDITVTDPLNDTVPEDEFHNLRGKVLIEPEAVPELRALFTVNHAVDDTANPLVTGPNFFDRVLDEAGFATEIREATVNNYIADISYELNDALTFRSTSSFIDTDLKISSVPGSPVFFRSDLRDGHDFTQELVMVIEDQQGSGLSGVVGAFYGDFQTDTDTNIQADLNAFLTGIPSGVLSPLQLGTSSGQTKSFALYGDLRYEVYGPFSILGGLRYQRDKVSDQANISGIDLNTFTPFVNNTNVEAEFDVLLPKAGLSFEIDDTQNITASARRGYRAGYTESVAGSSAQNDVDPEFVWTYELAYRYQSDDGGLNFGATAFYNDFSDQQVVLLDPVSFQARTVNAGSSKSYGLGLEGSYATGTGLSLFGSLGLLKTEIEDLPDAAACTASGGNCAGNEFPEAPSVTAAFGGTYRHHSGFFATADVSYTGSYFSNGDVDNIAAREIDSFFLANASIGYEMENFRAQLFVRNLLDNDYLTTIDSSLNRGAVGEGRTIGAEIGVKF